MNYVGLPICGVARIGYGTSGHRASPGSSPWQEGGQPKTSIRGIAIAVLGLATAILRQYTICESQRRSLRLANGWTVPMKCNWTAMAEIALGVPLVAFSALAMSRTGKEAA